MGMVPSPHTPPQHYNQVQGATGGGNSGNNPGGEEGHGAPSMTPQDQLSEFVKTL